jgi:hypothetical protein
MKPSLSILFTFSLLPVFLFGQVSTSNTSIKIEATFMASNSFTVDILNNVDSLFIYYKFHDSTSKQIKKDTSYSNCWKFFNQTIESGNIDSAVIILDSCEKMGEKYEFNSFDTVRIDINKYKDYNTLILALCDSLTYNSSPVLDGFTVEVTLNCNGHKQRIITHAPEITRNYYIYTILKQTFDIYRKEVGKNKNTLRY